MTDTLEPCPFCGGEAQVEFAACWVVECQDCAASTAGRDTEANAVSDWNRRAVPEEALQAIQRAIDGFDYASERGPTHRRIRSEGAAMGAREVLRILNNAHPIPESVEQLEAQPHD